MRRVLRIARVSTGLTAGLAGVLAFALANPGTAGSAVARTPAATRGPVSVAGSVPTAPSIPAPSESAPSEPAPATTTARPTPAPSFRRPARVSRSLRRKVVKAPRRPAGVTVAGDWVRPNNGPETSCFCMRWGSMHKGIDLAGKLGSPIRAVGAGVVLKAGPASGFGNWVVIQHANGDVSIYGHMRYFFVHAGEHVTAGEKIALVGDQGFSTGPHLHFEVHRGGLAGPAIDPVPWLRARGITVGPLDRNG